MMYLCMTLTHTLIVPCTPTPLHMHTYNSHTLTSYILTPTHTHSFTDATPTHSPSTFTDVTLTHSPSTFTDVTLTHSPSHHTHTFTAVTLTHSSSHHTHTFRRNSYTLTLTPHSHPHCHITYHHNRSCGGTKKHIHSHKQQSSPDIPDTVPAITPLVLETICQGIGCLDGFLRENNNNTCISMRGPGSF